MASAGAPLPGDGQALGVRARQEQLASALRSFALRAAGLQAGQGADRAAIEAGFARARRLGADPDAARRVAQVYELAANATSNEPAMTTLLHGFAGRPRRRFLPERGSPRTLETAALPVVVVHVIGPSRDPSVIGELDPPAGQAYLAMSAGHEGEGGIASPFGPEWEIRDRSELEDRELAEIQRFDPAREEMLATALDQALNGTSLMIVLEIGRARLLLPGDAQWGTWNAALSDPEWRELLRRTSFYKVGHHGSENATPVEFIEQLAPPDFWAMVSVTPHGSWKLIPKPKLLEALHGKTSRIARADQDASAPTPAFTVEPGVCVDACVPM